MLGVVFFVLPGMFAFFLWQAKRNGANYEPPAGRERWS